MAFEYLYYPFTYKFVKDQVVVVMKSRRRWLKKKLEQGEPQPQNCNEAHWEQLKKVLMQEENVDRVGWMTKVLATQKNTSWWRQGGDISVEKRMVYFCPFAKSLLIELTIAFMIKDFNFPTWAGWDLRGRAWEDPHITGDLNWMWKE